MFDKMKSAFNKGGRKPQDGRTGTNRQDSGGRASGDGYPAIPASSLFNAGALRINGNGDILDANLLGEIILQLAARNLAGRNLKKFFPDVVQNKALHEILSQAMGGAQATHQRSVQIKTVNNEVFLADLSVLPVPAQGQDAEFLVVLHLLADTEYDAADVEMLIRRKNLGMCMESFLKELDVQVSASRQLVSDLKNCSDIEAFQNYANIFGAQLDSTRQIMRKYKYILEKNESIRSTQINNIARKLLVEIDLRKKFDDQFIKLDKKLEDSSLLPEIEIDADAVFNILKDFFFNLYNSIDAGSHIEIQTQYQENRRDAELDAGSYPEVCVLFKWTGQSNANADETFALLGGEGDKNIPMAVPEIDKVDRELAEYGGQVKLYNEDNATVIGFHFPIPHSQS